MAFFTVNNVSIRGISACVPPKIEENRYLPFYTPEEAELIIKNTGIERKHIVDNGITNLDLCERAFYSLIDKLGWENMGSCVCVYRQEKYFPYCLYG